MAKKKVQPSVVKVDFDQLGLDLGFEKMVEPAQELGTAIDSIGIAVKGVLNEMADKSVKNRALLGTLSGVRAMRSIVDGKFEEVENSIKDSIEADALKLGEVVEASFNGVTNVTCGLQEVISITLGKTANGTKLTNEMLLKELGRLGLPDAEAAKIVETRKAFFFSAEGFLALERNNHAVYTQTINDGLVKVVRSTKIAFE